ncbi:MAG: excinuclease ABC subunit UvrC [Caldisericia bacterium]|nr:excinuclease ABC subunit UvrC [Caldisericia bacterium]MDD4614735.1 excinuclease ABC subunit UvrC [Caldisericia bacterium]
MQKDKQPNTKNLKWDDLLATVRSFPDSPGIYIMRNQNADVLYVGKATSLKKRVSSYFYHQKRNPRIRDLMEHVNSIEYIATKSAYEALILECNFIKRLLPEYNRALKDSKGYQYLTFTKEPFPSFLKSMRIRKDNGLYFGPFTSAKKTTYLHRLILKTFRLRNCKKNLTKKDQKPCLRYYMNQCPGCCAGNTTQEEYNKQVQMAIQFLKNDVHTIQSQLKENMTLAAKEQKYEYAALLRDQIQSIEAIQDKQRVITNPDFDGDLLAIYSLHDKAVIDLMKVREGKVIYEDHFYNFQTFEEEEEGILQSFLLQYYLDLSYFPPPKEILINIECADLTHIKKQILTKFPGSSLQIKHPKIGSKKHLVDFCLENAKKHFQTKFPHFFETLNPLLLDVQKTFQLPSIPYRIEGYDISHIQGQNTVGSMVVFINGKPAKKYYRYFKVRLAALPDDTGSLREVIQRRIQHNDEDFGTLPDVFLIDGGLGQLHAVSNVLQENDIHLPVLSLAKREELVFSEKNSQPIRLDREKSEVLRLFQQIRDESHRFAKKQYQLQHIKSTLAE